MVEREKTPPTHVLSKGGARMWWGERKPLQLMFQGREGVVVTLDWVGGGVSLVAIHLLFVVVRVSYV